MNIRRKWGKLILIVSLVAALAFLVPTTLAYMFDHAGSLINTFAPKTDVLTEAPVEIVIEKTVLSSTDKKMGPECFTFQLEDVTTGEKQTVTTDKNGAARFLLIFKAEDVGQPNEFKVSEVNDARKEVTYSDVIYTVKVNVTAVEDRPTATVQVDGKDVEACVLPFENIYAPGQLPPPTGDSSNLYLHMALMLLATAAMTLMLRKRETE